MVGGKGSGVNRFGENPVGVLPQAPESAYSGLQKSLQQEWSFMQRFTPIIGDTFSPV